MGDILPENQTFYLFINYFNLKPLQPGAEYMNYQYSSFGVLLLISSIILLFLSYYSYKNRSENLHKYFSALMFFAFIWCFASAGEYFSLQAVYKIFWVQLGYLGVALVPPLWFMFILSYGGYDKYLKPYFKAAILIIPLIIIFLALSYPLYPLLWIRIIPVSNLPGALLVYVPGPFFWVNIIYSFIMTLMGIIILLQIFNSSSRLYRPQISALILSGLLPLIFSLIYTTRTIPIPGLDVTPLGIVFSGFIIAIAIFKYDFLAIRPIMNQVLIKSMKNCLMVFDDKDNLIEINNHSKLLGLGEEIIGNHYPHVFENLPSITAFYENQLLESEIFIGGTWNIWVEIEKSPITDNGHNLGKIIIIKDITYRKLIQNQLTDSEERYKMLTDLSPDAVLVLIDEKIVFANKSSCNLLGASNSSELIGKNILDFLHPDFREISKKRLHQVYVNRKSLAFLEEKIITLDNQNKDIEIGDVPIIYDNQPAVQMVIRDITDRKKLEKELNKSLEEKDLMMKEIHHRVKNNLMVIQSLLNLQSSYIQDPAVLNIFKESQNRAKSMALIHQKLYQSQDLKRIDFGEYCRSLSRDLFNNYITSSDKIDLNLNVESLMLDVNTAIPLGLILNELLSNSLKYAFLPDKEGNITVEFSLKNSQYILMVSDNGAGLPDDFDINKSDSLGFKLIKGLSRQIDAEVLIEKGKGTKICIIFQEKPIVPL